ncbi:acyltransferase family protein [Blastococcus sp. SYSU D00813]
MARARGRAADVVHDDRALPALTGLRFLAALAVVVSHFSDEAVAVSPARVFEVLDGGRTAVTLFFVLSGFVLAYNYGGLAGKTARRRFWTARFARLYPVTVLSLALAAVGVAYAWMHRDQGHLLDWYALDSHVGASLLISLAAQLSMTTGWLPIASFNQPWNGPAWSIACEVFFYALFPVLIVWLRRLRWHGIALVLGGGWACQALLVVAIQQLAPEARGGFLVYQFPVTHLFEFVLGIGAALFFVRGGREWLPAGARRSLLLAVSLGGIVALSWWQPVSPAYLLMSPLFAGLVLALGVRPRRWSGWLAWRPLVLLGEASFALYLLHMPLLRVLQILHVDGWLGWLGMAAVIALSVPVFLLYETPARLRLRRLGRGPAAPEGRPDDADDVVGDRPSLARPTEVTS